MALLKLDKKLDSSIKRSKSESIWNNCNILYKGKTLHYNTCINKGIFFPHQLENYSYPITFKELQSRYNLDNIEFFNFLKVRAALSKAKLHNSIPSLPHFVTKINKLGHQVSHIYKLLWPKTSNLKKKLIDFWEIHSSKPLPESKWPLIWSSTTRNKISPVYLKQNYGFYIKPSGHPLVCTHNIFAMTQFVEIVKKKQAI